jgi:hypothetical protein
MGKLMGVKNKLWEDIYSRIINVRFYSGVCVFHAVTKLSRSCSSSVNIVPDYRLDDWGSISCRGKAFFL